MVPQFVRVEQITCSGRGVAAFDADLDASEWYRGLPAGSDAAPYRSGSGDE